MTVQNTVADGTKSSRRLSESLYGRLSRKFDEIRRRLDQGTLDFKTVMSQLQLIIEGLVRVIAFGGKSKAELIQALSSAGVLFGDYSKGLIESTDFVISTGQQVANTARVRLSSWFDHKPTTEMVFCEMERRGYKKVPAELAIYLRLEYEDQSEDELLMIGHEPIYFDGHLRLLCLCRESDGLTMKTYYAYPEQTWPLDCEFLFSAPE